MSTLAEGTRTHKMDARFRKRTYRDFAQFLEDLRFLARNAGRLRANTGPRLAPVFRERLMLTVTAVNKCRYCASFHGQLAIHAGMSAAETRSLLSGVVGDCPEDEAPALVYAQVWAEADGAPPVEARAELERIYGAGLAARIEIVLRIIRAGNLVGNSFDALMYRVSGGRVGG